MLRIVVDTSVVVSALRSRTGAANALLRRVALGELMPLATTALFLEYEAVLKRDEQRAAHGLGLGEVDQFLSAFASAREVVEVSFRWRPQLGDANDEMVLEAAVNGRADALVTHNVRDFRVVEQRFALRILRPGEFMRELES